MLQDSYFFSHHKKRHIDNSGLGVDCHGELKNISFTIWFNGGIILENIFVAKWSICCIIRTVFQTVNSVVLSEQYFRQLILRYSMAVVWHIWNLAWFLTETSSSADSGFLRDHMLCSCKVTGNITVLYRVYCDDLANFRIIVWKSFETKMHSDFGLL